MQDAIKEIINAHLGKVLVNEKISNYTTYRVGGKVRCICYPKGETELIKLIEILKRRNIKYLTLGNGCTVLSRDLMYDGVVIKLDNFNKIEVNDDEIYVEAGYPLIKLANVAVKYGLAGLEFASGIPGTVGGALFMNAGAYGEDMSKIVTSARILTDEGIKEYSNSELEFSYRTTVLQKHLDYVCLSVKLKLVHGNSEELEEIVRLRREQRRNSQPLSLPSAGSVFRNPPGKYAGEIIESLGLKGYTVGRAEVSPKHANFIVNNGNAKASDIKNIIDYIKLKAKNKYGINLHVEQRLINWVGVDEKESESEEESQN